MVGLDAAMKWQRTAWLLMTLQEGERMVEAPPRKGEHEVNVSPQGSPNRGKHGAASGCIHETRGAPPLGELEVLTMMSVQ